MLTAVFSSILVAYIAELVIPLSHEEMVKGNNLTKIHC